MEAIVAEREVSGCSATPDIYRACPPALHQSATVGRGGPWCHMRTGPRRSRFRGRGAMDRDYEDLGLTDEQRGRLRAMDEEQGREMAQFEERERLARRALEGLVPGAAGYAAARERYEEAQRQTLDARNRHRDRRDGVLTPDQRRTVGERRTSRGERGVGNDRREDRRDKR